MNVGCCLRGLWIDAIEVWQIITEEIFKESEDKTQCVKMSPVSFLCYQNVSWIFVTSTCNLEKRNCTFWLFCAKNHWPTTQFLVHFIQRSLGRPTIRSVVDRPGKNFSIILINHGRFGVFSASLKFERGRPRWILSDSRSTWKIQIVSKRMQIVSNVSM